MAGDKDGWKRGAMGIDGHENPGLRSVKDYDKRGISQGSFGEPMKRGDQMLGADLETWAPHSIREGKDSNRAKGKGSDTSPFTKGASATGRYASKGIGKFIAK